MQTQSLEEITEQVLGRSGKESSLFGKVKNFGYSLRRAAVMGVSALVIGCGGVGGSGGGSTAGYNVSIKAGTTDDEGKTTFTDKDTGKEVNIFVVGEEQQPISNASVTFFDGDKFEMFYIEDSELNYVPKLKPFPHNSEHHFKLIHFNTAPWTIEEYEDTGYVRSVEEWLKEKGKYIGCFTKDEIEQKNKLYSLILGSLLGLTQVVNTIDKTEKIADITGIKIADYNHEYYIIPYSGEAYFGSMIYYQPFTPSEETCNNLDDDCDKEIDEDDVCKTSEPTGTTLDLECYNQYTDCNSKWSSCISDCPLGSEGMECKCNCAKEKKYCCEEITCIPERDELASVVAGLCSEDLIQGTIEVSCK